MDAERPWLPKGFSQRRYAITLRDDETGDVVTVEVSGAGPVTVPHPGNWVWVPVNGDQT